MIRRLVLVGATLIPLAAGPPPGASATRLDPAMTVGPEACGECHDSEFAVWRETAHARLYASEEPLNRRPRAQEIAGKLGVRLIRHDSLCLSCHFTPTLSGGRVTAFAGVSCESCHGVARGWITVHNTFQGQRVRRAAESAAQRRERVERNVALGMYTPERIYDLVARCYGCHLVPEETLVETGGHTSGGSFDLAARIDAIRHNFVASGRSGNAPLPPELRRKLAVLGPALELEHGLRALAAAGNAESGYARALVRRAERALRDLSRIGRVVSVPEVDRLLATAGGLRLEAGNRAELTHGFERLAEAARSFSEAHDGSRLGALDAVLAGGTGAAVEGGEGEAADPFAELLAAAPEAAGGPAPDAGAAASGGGATPASAPGPARPAIPAVEGELRKRIREPLGRARVVGAGECGSCHRHARQTEWWFRDPHNRSARPLLERRPKAVEIATLYYGRAAGELMVKGGSVCMGCHGTVPTGDEAWEVADGVSCEHCHGPAGEYLKSHQEASPAERRRLGMADLGDPATRARACSSCHYVTDPRLLASGHPPGSEGFELAERSAKIVHWDRPQPAATALGAAYRQTLQSRGPVPQVRVARLDPAVVRSAAGTAASRSAGTGSGPGGLTGPASGYGARSIPAARPAFVPGAGASTAGGAPLAGPTSGWAAPIDLEALPADAADRPLDELLLLVKERIDALFAATGGGG
ncbi:MAG TPA: multiheme c-type cytochrome [Thermoanaerobaculia bacterium]|nr:multiheme c-type cytochrome [Thermoanaerobaculia bacterium]